MQREHVCSGAAAVATGSGSFVEKKSEASTLRKLHFVKYTSPPQLVLVCVTLQTPPAGGGAGPRHGKFEVGNLVVAAVGRRGNADSAKSVVIICVNS